MARRVCLSSTVLVMSALLISGSQRPAIAQDVAPDKPTKVAADAAYISTNGNSEVTTISGGDKLEHKHANWLFTQEARAVYGNVDGVETTAKYGAGLRGDYLVSQRLSSYLLGTWRREPFAGISRQFDEGVGLSWHAVVSKPHEVDLEGGAGLSQRLDTLHDQSDFGTARAGARYKYSFTEKAFLETKGSYLFNLKDADDSQGYGSVALIAPITGGFSMKFGYDVSYRNKPLPGLKTTDSSFSAGIQFAN
jgi:putative salt-induced outer membrane protein